MDKLHLDKVIESQNQVSLPFDTKRYPFMKNILQLLVILFASASIQAQHQNILISDFMQPNEPAIRINPYNTNQIMAGSNLNNLFISEDGGYRWEVSSITCPEYGVWGDPCIVVDTSQAFYYFHLSNPVTGNWIDRIVCQRTTDLGANWDNSYMGLQGAAAQDKEWAIVNRRNNNIYVTWTHFDRYGSSSDYDKSTIKFSKSTDQGATWSEAVVINEVDGNCVDSDNTVEGAVPAIGSDGEIYVSWAGPEGIVFDRSLDEGETWLDEDIFVSDIPGGWDYSIPGINRCNGLPVTVCDTSGGNYNGTIYINWTDQRNGTDDTDVWLVKSTDKGETWSDPIRVNDDAAGKQQFLTWLDIDQTTGYLYFVFYDRRNYDDNYTDVYMAVSKDGGESFTNFKISEEAFLPKSDVFFGDYTNISAHDGVIRPIWSTVNTVGNQVEIKVFTAIVDPESIGIDQKEQEVISLSSASPNPFGTFTTIKFKIKENEHLNIDVYDLSGKKVATLIDNKKFQAGKHFVDFHPDNYNLNYGAYFVKINGKNTHTEHKVIYVE